MLMMLDRYNLPFYTKPGGISSELPAILEPDRSIDPGSKCGLDLGQPY
jgi:hypothetical protein